LRKEKNEFIEKNSLEPDQEVQEWKSVQQIIVEM
jgi:hypothetical protein